MYNTDVIIIGAGPIGLFAAFQAGMLNMKTHIIDGQKDIGGQCITLYPEKSIYDIPGYPRISAKDLITQLSLQAEKFNPTYLLDQQAVQLKQNNDLFCVTTTKDITITSKVVLIAAGCGGFVHKKPPLQNIESFEEKSIFYQITNPHKFLGKKIVIAGGGDSAIDWAITLSEIAKKIYIVHRRNELKALPASINKIYALVEQKKIDLILNSQLNALIGNNGILENIVIRNFENTTYNLNADILLPFFGLTQTLGPIKNWGITTKNNQIIVDNISYMTNIPGIYAIGDIASYQGKLKLILTGFAEAASSLHDAYDRVFEGKTLHFEHSTTKWDKN